MNRREMLWSVARGLPAALVAGRTCVAGSAPEGRTGLGVAAFSFHVRGRAERSRRGAAPLGDPLNYLEYCHQLGAGGIQTGIGARDEAYAARLRKQAEAYGMFVEGTAGLPRSARDLERFEAQLRAAKQAGANVIRAAVGGRRYEVFDRAEQFHEFAKRTWNSLQLAEPVAARQRVRLAIENHKDFRVPELLDMLKRLDSRHVGVCVDVGNSFALLEDPMEVVDAFAPWAYAVHLKDMAVSEIDDGFLLADVPLGEGLLDLAGMVRVLQEARPEIRFSLEMATRDPLVVPCLTQKYWATLADVPGRDLAATLRFVRANATAAESLPRVSHLPIEEQIKLEEQNVKKCLSYAREHLGL